ncbi:hypothetical protein HY626_01410 [Candidatus Uhrbacteria bacterium]|nr:hypothetical protein [Candidatus Uhrbacteria bacterium]
MLDSFRLSHRQILIRNADRLRIEEFTFKTAGSLAATVLDPPDRALLGITQSVGDNMAFYGLWVHQHLRKIRTRNKASGNVRLAPLDERLLQVILLHKLMQRLDSRQSPELRVAHHAVGAMIQKDLTLLLAEVRLEQWSRIFNLSKLRGIDPREWEKHIAGASAATFVLMTLASREGAEVFLPTGHEDVYLGIDLFWVEQGTTHAVSVKCITGQDTPVRVWCVSESSHCDNDDRVVTDQRNISLGARRFASSEGRSCTPILVYVAKPEGSHVRLDLDWGRLTWPQQILETILDRCMPLQIDLAR